MNAQNLVDAYKDASVSNAAKILNGSVAFSSEADVKPVLAFYNDNPHAHVDARDPQELGQEARDGRLLLIRVENDIVAASSAFNYSVQKNSRPSWIEIGATRALGGFGTYPFMIASQVIQECLERPPENYIFANIYADNTQVLHLLGTKTGWDTFTVSDDSKLEAAYSGKKSVSPEEMSSWLWLRSTPNCLPHQARIVRDVIEKGCFINTKNPEQPVHLKLDLSGFALAAPEARRKLDMLAEGTFSDFLVQNGSQLTCQEVMDAIDRNGVQAFMAEYVF